MEINIMVAKKDKKTDKKPPKTSSLTGDHVAKPLVLLDKLKGNVANVRKDLKLFGSSLRIKDKTSQHITSKINKDLSEMEVIIDQLEEAQKDVVKKSGL